MAEKEQRVLRDHDCIFFFMFLMQRVRCCAGWVKGCGTLWLTTNENEHIEAAGLDRSFLTFAFLSACNERETSLF